MKKEKIYSGNLLKKEYIERILITLCFFLTPLICIMVFCLLNGHGINHINLYGMAVNDEIVYQKMVEGVVKYGIPAGYFGYNESHAAIGTFSTWSPFLLLPWAVMGKITGIFPGFLMFFNIIQLMFSMGLFAVLAKPDKEKSFLIIALYIVFLPFTYYALLKLPEVTCYSLIIIFLAILFSLYNSSKLHKTKIILLFLISILLTWMRPYYLILTFFPSYEFIKRCKKKIVGILVSGVLIMIIAISYIWIYKNLCAPFFKDLLNFDRVENIISGIASNSASDAESDILTDNVSSNVSGVIIKSIFTKLLTDFIKPFFQNFRTYIIYVRNGILGGAGVASAGILVELICLIICFKNEWKEKKRDSAIITGITIVFFFLTFCAACVMFSIDAAEKHFLELIVMGIFVLGMKSNKKTTTYLIIILSWLFLLQFDKYRIEGKDYFLLDILDWGTVQLENHIEIDPENDPWDNTIIWVEDYGELNYDVWWRGLYAVPSGMGISFCSKYYVINNFENLSSKYLYTDMNDVVINGICEEHNATLIAEYGNARVWELR